MTIHLPAWTESVFERWFIDNPILPDGQRVILIRRQQALRRVVDFLALSEDGTLLIIEVKNEKSTRTVIGQALEYLSQYADATLEDLEDEYQESSEGSIQETFRETFPGSEPKLTERRAVIIVAPAFDIPSAVCTKYLTQALSAATFSFQLVIARLTGSRFALSTYESPELVLTRDLKNRFATTPAAACSMSCAEVEHRCFGILV
jgi:hypothetical protein